MFIRYVLWNETDRQVVVDDGSVIVPYGLASTNWNHHDYAIVSLVSSQVHLSSIRTSIGLYLDGELKSIGMLNLWGSDGGPKDLGSGVANFAVLG